MNESNESVYILITPAAPLIQFDRILQSSHPQVSWAYFKYTISVSRTTDK